MTAAVRTTSATIHCGVRGTHRYAAHQFVSEITYNVSNRTLNRTIPIPASISESVYHVLEHARPRRREQHNLFVRSGKSEAELALDVLLTRNPEHFLEANPLITPFHIQPEYDTFFSYTLFYAQIQINSEMH